MRKLQWALVALLVILAVAALAEYLVESGIIPDSEVDETWLASKRFESQADTRYFTLYADLLPREAQLTGRHLDDFVDLVVSKGLVLTPSMGERRSVYLLREADWAKADPSRSSFGFYESKHKRIFLNYDMGIGTVNHEIVYYLLDTSPTEVDWFDASGLAMAFEKTITFYSPRSDAPPITYGYLHPRRTNYAMKYVDEQIGGDTRLAVERLLAFGSTSTSWREKPYEMDLVGTLFNRMLRENRLPGYVSEIGSGKDRRARLETAFGKPLERVWTEQVEWLRGCLKDPDFELVGSTFIAEGSGSPVVDGRPTRFDSMSGRWSFVR